MVEDPTLTAYKNKEADLPRHNRVRVMLVNGVMLHFEWAFLTSFNEIELTHNIVKFKVHNVMN